MKTTPTQLRRATGLLLAAAALPITPLLAQEAQPATGDPPVAEETTPATATQTPVEPVSQPVAITPPTAPVVTPEPAVQAAEAPPVRRIAPARTTARAAPRPATVRGQTTVVSSPVATNEVTPSAETPTATALPVETLPASEALPETAPVADTAPAREGGGSNFLWLLAGALLVGALALFLLRRSRSRSQEVIYDEVYDEPAPIAEPEPIMAAVPMAVPLASTAADQPAESATAAAPLEAARPQLDLVMRPVRAGVTGDEAVVEFALDVQNEGSAAARDVRISTWMFPAGSARESEMERNLIERTDDDSTLPETTIEAGAGKRIETAVALPTSGFEGDAVLPVVVAEARYRLPDGSEGRTSARYAVGVPDGEELAHFAIDNPSGLHEDVEARPLGELERA